MRVEAVAAKQLYVVGVLAQEAAIKFVLIQI
jgi:hypothetical protein